MFKEEAGLTEEQLKEQKLEAARKKYEELKNKSKKKKKKSKKDKIDEEEEEPSAKDENVESTEAAKEVETNDEANKDEAATEKYITKEEPKEVEFESEEAKEEPKEVEAKSEEIIEDPKEGTKEEPKEEPREEPKEEPKEELKEEPKEKVNATKEDNLSKDLDNLKVNEQATEKPPTDVFPETAVNDQLDDLFPNSGPSFMDTIKQSQPDKALLKVQQENQALKAELEKTKAENKDLKLLKLDHLEQIETLELKVSNLESKLAKAKVDSSIPDQRSGVSAYDLEDTLSLSPTPSFQQSFPTSFSQFKPHHKNDSQLIITETKARLNEWKNWNIDMTNWRSVGSGPIVEL